MRRCFVEKRSLSGRVIDMITLSKRTRVVRVDLQVNAGTSLKYDVMAGPVMCRVIGARFLC